MIATDKKVTSVLVDGDDYQKIQLITPQTGKSRRLTDCFFKPLKRFLLSHAGFVYAGMGPDFRVIVRNARKAAQKYYLTYREVQPLSQVYLISPSQRSFSVLLPRMLKRIFDCSAVDCEGISLVDAGIYSIGWCPAVWSVLFSRWL